jgi:hypothetical protein
MEAASSQPQVVFPSVAELRHFDVAIAPRMA